CHRVLRPYRKSRHSGGCGDTAMKERLTELLVCPSCKGNLALTTSHRLRAEVNEGALHCEACQAEFPIRDGVPRFVGSGSYATSFGFQWSRFRTVQMDLPRGGDGSERELMAKTGFSADELKGQLVLDAGVGAGRYAEVVSRWGAEVVGVDLTAAVDAAYQNVGTRSGIHLVQADIFALPFRDDTFDVVYSIGVLHHTPSPPDAFRCVSRTVRKGGTMAVYIYPALGVARHFSDAIRKATTRLPKSILVYLAWASVPLYYVYRLPV